METFVIQIKYPVKTIIDTFPFKTNTKAIDPYTLLIKLNRNKIGNLWLVKEGL